MIDIALNAKEGWRRVPAADGEVWFSGYLYEGGRQLTVQEAAARFAALPAEAGPLAAALRSFDGLFAAVVLRGGTVIAVTDHIASIPLLIHRAGNCTRIAGRAAALFPGGSIDPDDIDGDAASILAMSGCTIGSATLAHSVKWLPAGSFAVSNDGDMQTGRYYVYAAWEASPQTEGDWPARLEAVLRETFARTVRALDGRTALLPLSAGLDSRLIVSAFRMLGYDKVKCFAYGQPGNFEAIASRQIAERLGYPWTFVPYTHAAQRRAMGKGGHAEYRRSSDTLAAVPFEQDYFALTTLLESGWAARDAVVINGQSGDFITGNHIPQQLGPDAASCEDWQPIYDALIAKHYSLWRAAKTPEALAKVRAALGSELDAVGAPVRPGKAAFGLYECLEYDNRQSKYVVGGQRVYEFLGMEWRLPLWEKPLVEFCRTLPVEHKYKQRLYRETLRRLDWGGVWHGIDNRPRVSPAWLRPIRHMARAASAPLGRDRWHGIERRFFVYWADIVCNYAHLDYGRVVRDRRGFRNSVSWFAEAYLARHGLDWRGRVKSP